jgi:hypothetical protein
MTEMYVLLPGYFEEIVQHDRLFPVRMSVACGLPLTAGVAMICIANDCVKSAYQTAFHQLLAQSLFKTSDFMICELYTNHTI